MREFDPRISLQIQSAQKIINNMRIKKQKIVEIVKANYLKYCEELQDKVDLYREEYRVKVEHALGVADELLEERAKQLAYQITSDQDVLNMQNNYIPITEVQSVYIPVPKDYSERYVKALRYLELVPTDTQGMILLKNDEYKNFVDDDWETEKKSSSVYTFDVK